MNKPISDSVIVTGSNGFIGRHLVRQLKGKYNVIEWDLNLDVRKISEFNTKAKTVFHLAAIAQNAGFKTHTHESLDININGTLAVLNYCRKYGASCILTSTSGVYGLTDSEIRVSEKSKIHPYDLYSTSKWLAENICFQQSIETNTKVVILRLFNVYGYSQNSSFIIPYIIDCLINNKQAYIQAPNAFRDFIYIEDVINAALKASEYKSNACEVFNIGSGKSITVLDTISIVEKIFNHKINIKVNKNNLSINTGVIADISKAKRSLLWEPMCNLEKGLCKIKKLMEV